VKETRAVVESVADALTEVGASGTVAVAANAAVIVPSLAELVTEDAPATVKKLVFIPVSV